MPLDRVQTTIGRGPDSTIVCDMDNVSRPHCKIYAGAGGNYIEDMGSTNGTYIDRTKVTTPTPVKIGVPVRIGKTVVELRK